MSYSIWNTPSRNNITELYRKFIELGSVLDIKDYCCPSISDKVMEHICESFKNNPKKLSTDTSTKSGIPPETVHKILQKSLWLYSCKVELLQVPGSCDMPMRMLLASDILD
jgi:hypothetical protein